MKPTLRELVARVARDRGTPDALSREIVDLALLHLKPPVRNRPRQRDLAHAVDEAWSEWSRRLCAALDALAPPSAAEIPGSAPPRQPSAAPVYS